MYERCDITALIRMQQGEPRLLFPRESVSLSNYQHTTCRAAQEASGVCKRK